MIQKSNLTLKELLFDDDSFKFAYLRPSNESIADFLAVTSKLLKLANLRVTAYIGSESVEISRLDAARSWGMPIYYFLLVVYPKIIRYFLVLEDRFNEGEYYYPTNLIREIDKEGIGRLLRTLTSKMKTDFKEYMGDSIEPQEDATNFFKQTFKA